VNGEHRKRKKAAKARRTIRTERWKEIETRIGNGNVKETKECVGTEF
jgi:hypothetical protein